MSWHENTSYKQHHKWIINVDLQSVNPDINYQNYLSLKHIVIITTDVIDIPYLTPNILTIR